MNKTANIAIVGLGQIGNYLYNEIKLKKKNIEENEGIKDYTQFDGINDDWEEFNERDFSSKKGA